MGTIRFISHPGNRSVQTFERELETIDETIDIEPFVEVSFLGHRGPYVERVFRINGRYFFGGTFDQYLTDVEVDGSVVSFDGEVPHLNSDWCYEPQMLATADSVFVEVQTPGRPLVVLRDASVVLIFARPGEMSWAHSATARHGRVELARVVSAIDDEHVVVHDPEAVDLRGFLAESIETSRRLLREAAQGLRQRADQVEARADGTSDHESIQYLAIPRGIEDASLSLDLAETLLRETEQSA